MLLKRVALGIAIFFIPIYGTLADEELGAFYRQNHFQTSEPPKEVDYLAHAIPLPTENNSYFGFLLGYNKSDIEASITSNPSSSNKTGQIASHTYSGSNNGGGIGFGITLGKGMNIASVYLGLELNLFYNNKRQKLLTDNVNAHILQLQADTAVKTSSVAAGTTEYSASGVNSLINIPINTQPDYIVSFKKPYRADLTLVTGYLSRGREFLLYGKGGMSASLVKIASDMTTQPTAYNFSRILFRPVWGGGIRWYLSPDCSIDLEYLNCKHSALSRNVENRLLTVFAPFHHEEYLLRLNFTF